MEPYAVGIDGGAVTGVAAWDSTGLLWSYQDELRVALTMLEGSLRAQMPAVLAVEGAYIGQGKHASLVVANTNGFIKGVLWRVGYRSEVWQPLAVEWRKVLGIKGRREKVEEQARLYAKSITGKNYAVKTTHEAEAICIAKVTWERRCAARR